MLPTTVISFSTKLTQITPIWIEQYNNFKYANYLCNHEELTTESNNSLDQTNAKLEVQNFVTLVLIVSGIAQNGAHITEKKEIELYNTVMPISGSVANPISKSIGSCT